MQDDDTNRDLLVGLLELIAKDPGFLEKLAARLDEPIVD